MRNYKELNARHGCSILRPSGTADWPRNSSWLCRALPKTILGLDFVGCCLGNFGPGDRNEEGWDRTYEGLLKPAPGGSYSGRGPRYVRGSRHRRAAGDERSLRSKEGLAITEISIKRSYPKLMVQILSVVRPLTLGTEAQGQQPPEVSLLSSEGLYNTVFSATSPQIKFQD